MYKVVCKHFGEMQFLSFQMKIMCIDGNSLSMQVRASDDFFSMHKLSRFVRGIDISNSQEIDISKCYFFWFVESAHKLD